MYLVEKIKVKNESSESGKNLELFMKNFNFEKFLKIANR